LQLSPTAEVSLQSLPDPAPGVKPPQPLPLLIKLAIYGSPDKKLTLQEIYTALENRFEWFKKNSRDKAWKVCSLGSHKICLLMLETTEFDPSQPVLKQGFPFCLAANY
jgi:hypothetical protein